MTEPQRYYLRQWAKDVLTWKLPINRVYPRAFGWTISATIIVLELALFDAATDSVSIQPSQSNLLTMQRCREQQLRTRKTYEYKGLPVLDLTEEDRVEFTRLWNTAMNEANK